MAIDETHVQWEAFWRDERQSTHWYQALSLNERFGKDSGDSEESAFNAHYEQSTGVAERIRRWKEQRPFQNDVYFKQRLAQDGLIEQAFSFLLLEDDDSLGQRLAEHAVLPWLERLINAFGRDYADITEHQSIAASNLIDAFLRRPDTPGVAFLRPLRPLLFVTVEQLLVDMQVLTKQYKSLPFTVETVMPMLLQHMAEQIVPKLAKTMVLELNVARVQGQLQGETPEARFACFIQQLSTRQGMQTLLKEYVVLARILVETFDRWVVYELELLNHLCQDWVEIRALFTPDEDPGALLAIQALQGDTHRGGRSVAVLAWRSGFRLLYKPRSLAVDRHFQTLLQWVNQHNEYFDFKTYRVLDKEHYGWNEFISNSHCETLDAVERFYLRQGGYLALLYALEATDFHAENVIAAGEYPMLIDLEALLHPIFSHEEDAYYNYPGVEALARSVLHIGLLPERLGTKDTAEGIDISGLGAQPGQLSSVALPTWGAVGTDQMQMRRERVVLNLGHNRATLQGKHVDTLTYRDVIVQGFELVYSLLLQRRAAFHQEVLTLFGQDEVRCLLRPTRTYEILLNTSYHPDNLRNALERDRFFDNLWSEVVARPYLSRCIAAECADLRDCDIPLFTAYVHSRDLMTSRGEHIKDFFKKSSLESVSTRILALDEQDLARQSWIIKAAFTSIRGDDPKTAAILARSRAAFTSATATKSVVSSVGLLSAAALEQAIAIGERLRDLSVEREGRVGWLGVSRIGEDVWHVMAADSDLYNGLSGIVLYMAYLGYVTHQDTYTTLSQHALNTVRSEFQLLLKRAEVNTIGAFCGLGSYLYVLSHVSVLWQDESLLQEAESYLPLLVGAIKHNEDYDLFGGAAGCIMALLSLYTARRSQRTLEVAMRFGEHLLANAQLQEHGLAWPTRSAPMPLTGLAYGNAGIALSLLQLGAISGEERFHTAALSALAYERAHFSAEHNNWPDLRQYSMEQQRGRSQIAADTQCYPVTWHSGAPGIALARLQGLAQLNDAQVHAEITLALQTTLQEGFGKNHSLYEGDLGNLDVLLQASLVLGEAESGVYHAYVQQRTQCLLQSMREQGWITAAPQGVETPGLLFGLSGIGYELLRLAMPENIPSVLSLAAPGQRLF